MTPIPGGYPLEHRIENAAQFRLTESGLRFLETHIGTILQELLPEGLDFDVSSDTICRGGGCFIHGEIDDAAITPVAPNRLNVRLPLRITSRDAAGARASIRQACFDVLFEICCDIDVNTAGGARSDVVMEANIDLNIEVAPERSGYTRIDVLPSSGTSFFAAGQSLEASDFNVSGGLTCEIADLFRSFVAGEINRQFGDQIQGVLEEQLCTRRGMVGCPTGTFAVPNADDPASVCRFENVPSAACVPVLLGADGRGDFGAAALGSVSPGAHAPGQFLLASGGEGEAVEDGMSLFAYGGFMGTDRFFSTTPAHHPCVPVTSPPPLPVIPRLDAFRDNAIPGSSTSAHLGFGVSEQFLDYAGWGLFDSGMLCVAAGTPVSPQLNTGLFSLFIGSLRTLAFPHESAPMSIAFRPGAPPDFEVGTGSESDPLLVLHLPRLSADFYVFSMERYVRVLTLEADVTLPIDLEPEDGRLRPVLGEVSVESASVSHTELLREDPAMLADSVGDLFPTLLTAALGDVSAIDLPTLLGFDLVVPERGIRGVSEAGDEFLSVFANLEVPGAGEASTVEVNTHLRLDRAEYDRRALELGAWKHTERPSVRAHFSAEGPSGAPYEFSYRVDGGPWSAWSPGRDVTIADRMLRLQARHEIEARGRVLGEPRSADQSPAIGTALIDALAPDVTLGRFDDHVRVSAADVISPLGKLTMRYRIDGSRWSEWTALASSSVIAVGHDDARVEVEVRDESGNVSSARAALIRGQADPNGNGCQCRVAGTHSAPSLCGWLFAGGLLLSWRRRRIARALTSSAWLGGAVLAILVAGCGGRKHPSPPSSLCEPGCVAAQAPFTAGMACCDATRMCVAYDLDDLCEGPSMICANAAAVALDAACIPTCTSCIVKPPLDPGLLATHLDFVPRGDGSILVSGYSPGLPNNQPLGDLVVAVTDAAATNMAWEIVDGAPSSPSTHDPTGVRAGVSAPGDDVGQWTSIAANASTAYVSYYDATHGALKIAVGAPGAWSSHVVDDVHDSGRYSSIALRADGNPVVAYMRMGSPSPSTLGKFSSSLEVAEALVPLPTSSADWTITEIAFAETACRPAWCEQGQQCLKNLGACVVPTADCSSDCGDRVCYLGRCEPAIAEPFLEDWPVALGLYAELATTPDGLAVVFYDRTGGNLWGVRKTGGAWGAAFLIDGYARLDPTVGDSGIGASLFVDTAGVWHVTYVDGTEESLRYARVEGSTVTTEVIDAGYGDGVSGYSDGRHIVGDDSSIVVDSAGVPLVVYQDATNQTARLARRVTGMWQLGSLDAEDSTGFFLEQHLDVTGRPIAVTFWRNEANRTSGVRWLRNY